MAFRGFISKLISLWYKRQLDRYYIELDTLNIDREKSVHDALKNEQDSNVSDELLYGVNNVINFSEDEEKNRLDKKYKKALEWRGMLFGAGFGDLNGFKFVVHSHDHDRHLHIIHRGRGIDARFSFPDLKLLNYKKEENRIGRKEEKEITEYLKEEEIFKKVERFFDRRDEGKLLR